MSNQYGELYTVWIFGMVDLFYNLFSISVKNRIGVIGNGDRMQEADRAKRNHLQAKLRAESVLS